MGLFSGLAGLVDPAGANNVASAGYAIGQTLAPGSAYNSSGNLGLSTPGSAGNTALTHAIQAGSTPLAAHTGAMDADASQLGALSNLYYGLYRNGGPAEAAAVQQSAADIASSGPQNLRAQSRVQADNLTQVSNAERGGNAAQSTETGQNSAMTKLQKFVYQAAASHANHVNALNATNIQNALLNQQVNLDQQLRDHSTSAQSSAFNTALQNQQNINTMGNTVLQAGLAAGANSAATGLGWLTKAPAQTYTTDASGNRGGIVSAVPAPGIESYGAAGYQPTYQTPVAAPAVTSTPYSPTNTVYPTSASEPGDWLGGSIGLVG